MSKPTFLLKPSAYKTDKLYAILPDNGNGDMAVSSYLGNGTRVRSDGIIEAVATDTPRLDYHNGIGLLLEPTRANLIINSGDLTSFTKSTSLTRTSNDNIAPDGTKTAAFIEDSSATTLDSLYYDVTVSDATAIHTASIFIKFGSRDDIVIKIHELPGIADIAYITFNSDGTTFIDSDPSGVASNAKMDDYGNGWWRCMVTYDMSNTDTGIRITLYPGSGYLIDADQMGYCWAWGAQLEEGYYATSYIPTTATALTRAYDSLTVGSVVTNGLIGYTNGSFYVDVELSDSIQDGVESIARIGTTNGYVLLSGTIGATYATVDIQNTDASTVSYAIESRRIRALFNLFGDKTEIWVNGVKVVTEISDLSLTDELLRLKGDGSSSKIKEIAMYKRTLSDTDSKARTQ